MGYQTRMFASKSIPRLRAKHPSVRLDRVNQTPPGCGNSISFALVDRDEYHDSQMAFLHDNLASFQQHGRVDHAKQPIPHFPCVTGGKPGEIFRNRPCR